MASSPILLTLYTSPGSFRAFPVLLAAEYCNSVSIKLDDDVAKGARLSLTGKTPVLTIQNKKSATTVTLFGSHAIARYIAGTRDSSGDSSLMGTSTDNIAASSMIDCWMDFAAQQIELPACVWFYPVAGFMPFHADAYVKAKTDLANALSILDKHLHTSSYLVGNSITLADICVISTLWYPFTLVCDATYRQPYTHVMRWFELCVNLPEFKAVLGSVVLCEMEGKARQRDT